MLFLALALHRVHVRDGQLRSAIKLAEAFELGAPAPQGVVAEGLLWNGRSQRAEAAPAGAHSLDAVHVVGVHGERQAVVVGLPDDARHVALEVRGAVTAAAGVVVVGKGGSVGDVSAGMHLLLRALGGLDEGGGGAGGGLGQAGTQRPLQLHNVIGFLVDTGHSLNYGKVQ